MTTGLGATLPQAYTFDEIGLFEDLLDVPRRANTSYVRREPRPPEINTFTGRIIRPLRKRHPLRPHVYQDRSERLRTRLMDTIRKGRTAIGKSYSFTVSGSVGVFSVYGVDVATLDLERSIITSLYIPKEEEVPSGQYSKQINLVRLLFRRLGLKAVRNKAFTVVESGDFIMVLEPGETWNLPTQASPILLPEKIKADWTQLPLISEELYRQAEKAHNDEKQRKQLEEYNRFKRQQYATRPSGFGSSTASGTSTWYIDNGTGTSTTATISPFRIYRTTTF